MILLLTPSKWILWAHTYEKDMDGKAALPCDSTCLKTVSWWPRQFGQTLWSTSIHICKFFWALDTLVILVAQLFLLPLIHYHTCALNSGTNFLFSSLSHSSTSFPSILQRCRNQASQTPPPLLRAAERPVSIVAVCPDLSSCLLCRPCHAGSWGCFLLMSVPGRGWDSH